MTTNKTADRRTTDPSPSADTAAAEAGESGGRRVDPATVRLIGFAVVVVALIAAVCAAGWYGYRAYDVYFVQKPIQETRDGAVDGAEQAILNVTTIDPKNTKDWQRRIDGSLTGKARSQITPDDVSKLNEMLSQAGDQASTLTSRLLRSAPQEVDADAHTAKVLVFVAATSKKANEAGVTQTMGFTVSMTKDGDIWKADNIVPLDSIPLEDSSTQSGGQPSGEQAPAPAPEPAPAPGTGGN